jgi:glycosyltransferase involved in cell wall biosynthesis
MITPRVSVLMPVRNGLPWLRDALDSLARQTLRELEIIVLEDGSTDGTAGFLGTWTDDRIRIIPTAGIGMARALNVGLDAARAPFVARHDADDVSAPIRMEAQLRYLLSRPDIDVVASTVDYIDADGRPVVNEWVRTVRRQQDAALAPHQIAELMPLTCCVTHGSIMARVEVLRAAGGYRPDIWPVEDYDLWLRLLPGAAIAKMSPRLYRYRLHEAQLSAQVRDEQLRQALAA